MKPCLQKRQRGQDGASQLCVKRLPWKEGWYEACSRSFAIQQKCSRRWSPAAQRQQVQQVHQGQLLCELHRQGGDLSTVDVPHEKKSRTIPATLLRAPILPPSRVLSWSAVTNCRLVSSSFHLLPPSAIDSANDRSRPTSQAHIHARFSSTLLIIRTDSGDHLFSSIHIPAPIRQDPLQSLCANSKQRSQLLRLLIHRFLRFSFCFLWRILAHGVLPS